MLYAQPLFLCNIFISYPIHKYVDKFTTEELETAKNINGFFYSHKDECSMLTGNIRNWALIEQDG